MNQVASLILLFLFDLLILVCSILVFHCIWIKPFGIEIPITFQPPIKNVQKRYKKRVISTNTTNFNIVFKYMYQLLSGFDPSYWIKYTGLDGYMYLSY